MNCKLKAILFFLVYCAAAYLAVRYVPPEWGGYVTLVILIALAAVGLLAWLVSVIHHVRNPYQGGQNLRRSARKIAATDGIDINTAANEIYEDAKAKGQTYPKRDPDTMPRPVMVDRVHLQHIRGNETMPFAGYDQTPAEDTERFGVVQQPGLPAGNEVEGIPVDMPQNRQNTPIKR